MNAPSILGFLPAWARRKLVLRNIEFDARRLANVEIRIPESLAEYDAASQLLFNTYTDAGLIAQPGVRVRMNAFLALPASVRFVAIEHGEVVGTLSLVPDSMLGLPMEKSYPDEVRTLRQRRPKLAEIGALAVRDDHRHSGLVFLLYKAMWKVARLIEVSDLVIGVRERAELLYRTVLCFETLGSPRHYSGLKEDVVGVALRLDLETADAVFERSFSEGRGFNPFEFFCRTTHLQLRLPESLVQWEATRQLHAEATLRLLALRPDVLIELSDNEFSILSEALAQRRSRG